jgi:hypothetical protein
MVRELFEVAHATLWNDPLAHTSLAEMRSLLEGTLAYILRVACHVVQDEDPLKSAVVLQDGKLSIEDFMALNLPHAVLTFLSACQTAKGDHEGGPPCGVNAILRLWHVQKLSLGSPRILSHAGLCTTRTAPTWRGVCTRRSSGRIAWTSRTYPTRWTRSSKASAKLECLPPGGRSSCIRGG